MHRRQRKTNLKGANVTHLKSSGEQFSAPYQYLRGTWRRAGLVTLHKWQDLQSYPSRTEWPLHYRGLESAYGKPKMDCFYTCYIHDFSLQGLTILFLVVTLCADLLCLVVLPIHWLFFAASTYVWVHFVWNTGNPFIFFLTLFKVMLVLLQAIFIRKLKMNCLLMASYLN